MFKSLIHFREQMGVSQSFMAKNLGVHRITYMNYELGRTKPPPSFYYHLAHIFRFPVDDILPISKIFAKNKLHM